MQYLNIQASKNHESAGTILTQAKRIELWLKLTDKKKTNSATMFDGGLEALRLWTSDGTRCRANRNSYEGTAFSTLKNCSTTATHNCDSSVIDTTILNPCKAEAERIVESYYVGTYFFIFFNCQVSCLSPNPHHPAII